MDKIKKQRRLLDYGRAPKNYLKSAPECVFDDVRALSDDGEVGFGGAFGGADAGLPFFQAMQGEAVGLGEGRLGKACFCAYLFLLLSSTQVHQCCMVNISRFFRHHRCHPRERAGIQVRHQGIVAGFAWIPVFTVRE